MERSDCAFCKLPEKRIVYRGEYAKVAYSLWPIENYHFMSIPKRHVELLSELKPEEILGIFEAALKVNEVVSVLNGTKYFNTLLNQGPAAGQTVPHLHVHFVPRLDGDLKDSPLVQVVRGVKLLFNTTSVESAEPLKSELDFIEELVTDPTGGVRNVIPGMGNYKKYPELIPKREEDVMKWTDETRKVLREKAIASQSKVPVR
jgi:diadenosine tetraphosphate (Ap4A) HIT family hydrolase